MNARYERVPSTAGARATTITNGVIAPSRKTSRQMAKFARPPALAAGNTMARLTATTGATLLERAGTSAERLCQIFQQQVQDRRDHQ